MNESDLPIMTTIPVWGLIVFDLSRSSAYEAAKAEPQISGFPIIEVAGRKRVPTRIGLRELACDDSEVLKAITADFAAKFARLEASEAAATLKAGKAQLKCKAA